MVKKLFLFAAAVLAVLSCKPAFEVYDLRCEGLTEPLGIDSAEPHFSWKIASREPMAQTAYEIQVARSEKALLSGAADCWASGRVLSPDQVMVPYGGAPLSSRQQLWWRVRVWKSDQEASAWSRPQRLGIGLIGGDVLRGNFIGAVPGEGRSPLLRKSFSLDRKPSSAILYVTSLGYHEVYLNGRKVSDAVLSPAVSQLDKRALIVPYDVTTLLKKGSNEIVIHAGTGWYRETTFGAVYDGPLVKAELDAFSPEGGRPLVWTDASWEGAWSGYADPNPWTWRKFGGEIIDARVTPEWSPVDVVPVSGIAESMQMCEPCRVQEVLTPVSVEQVGDSSWRVDFGQIVNAMLDVDLPELPAGHVTTASVSEQLPGKHKGRIIRGGNTYISSGKKGGDTFEARFNHHVFRYVQLDSLPVAPELTQLRARRMRTDYAWDGSFASSDEDLNQIHGLVERTMENLAFAGYMVDCAFRERLGYGGDGNASTLSLQTVADVSPLYMNWLQAWCDAIQPDGGLPHTAPCPYEAGGGPYWCTFLVQAPWRTWIRYGDDRLLQRCYPAMKHWLEYVDAHTVDGLLRKWPDVDSYRWWYLGDWAAPKDKVNVKDPASIDLVNNCALCQTYLEWVQIAQHLGLEEDAKDFQARYDALSARIHEAFYDPEEGIYASGSQVDLVYPLLTGVVPQPLQQAVRDTLAARTERLWDGHLVTGLVGVPVLSEWAAREGECDWMYGMLKKRDYPGYLYMIDSGGTGVWEEWDGSNSHLHNCFNGIGSWFYQALGGITAEEPGFRRVRIEPQVPRGLEWVKVTQPTPYGPIRVSREGTVLTIDIPVGITALVRGGEYGPGHHIIHL